MYISIIRNLHIDTHTHILTLINCRRIGIFLLEIHTSRTL